MVCLPQNLSVGKALEEYPCPPQQRALLTLTIKQRIQRLCKGGSHLQIAPSPAGSSSRPIEPGPLLRGPASHTEHPEVLSSSTPALGALQEQTFHLYSSLFIASKDASNTLSTQSSSLHSAARAPPLHGPASHTKHPGVLSSSTPTLMRPCKSEGSTSIAALLQKTHSMHFNAELLASIWLHLHCLCMAQLLI